MHERRTCEIVFAGIGTSDQDLLPIVDCDDGAYDLHEVRGTPAEIGKAIADSLRDSDLFHGTPMKARVDDEGDTLYLTIKIKFYLSTAQDEDEQAFAEPE